MQVKILSSSRVTHVNPLKVDAIKKSRLIEFEGVCGKIKICKRGPLDVLSLSDRLSLRPLFYVYWIKS